MGLFKSFKKALGLARKGASGAGGQAVSVSDRMTPEAVKPVLDKLTPEWGKSGDANWLMGFNQPKQVAPVQGEGSLPKPPEPIPAPEPTMPAAQERAEPKVRARVKLMKKARTFFGGGGLVKTITNYLTGQ